MIDEGEKYQVRLTNKLSEFSARYMSDTKWTKLFKALSLHSDLIGKCLIKDVWDDVLRELKIPMANEYADVFHDKGIKDVMTGGPTAFKQIEWIEFPSNWEISRTMGKLKLEPFIQTQDVSEIKRKIEEIGQLESEMTSDKLIIYGYKR